MMLLLTLLAGNWLLYWEVCIDEYADHDFLEDSKDQKKQQNGETNNRD